jgi:ATP-dependent helicase/nuclease subunit B
MSLRLIYGRSGTGKSYFCMQEIRKILEDQLRGQPKRPLILLVPEQYSMQAERALVQTAPRGGAIDAQVLSFRRMAYRVFNEVGGFTRRHISPSGRSMLIYRIIQELKDNLNYFGKVSNSSSSLCKGLSLIRHRGSMHGVDTALFRLFIGLRSC